MANIDWNSLINGNSGKKRGGPSVKFFNAYQENAEKSRVAGRAIFDEIPSISIQWPGQDETVRRIEPRDKDEYPELYAAFMANAEPVESGTPLKEWSPLPGSALRELQYLGFRTVEQLAGAHDELKRKMGPLSQFVKKAQEWLDAANSSQNVVMALKEQLERMQSRNAKLEEQVELLLQRVEANEGTRMSARKESAFAPIPEEELDESPRRGRPRKSLE